MESIKNLKSLSTQEIENIISNAIGNKLNDKITSEIKILDYNINEENKIFDSEPKIVIHLKQRTSFARELENKHNNRDINTQEIYDDNELF